MRRNRWIGILAPLLFCAIATASPTIGEDDPGWIGVMLGGAGVPAVDAEDESAPKGVSVRYVVKDSPAADAGLRGRDRILTIDGTPVESNAALFAALRGQAAGNWIGLTVMRGKAERQLRIRLGRRPKEVRSLEMRRAWIGVQAIDLPPALREHFGAPAEAGVMISAVEVGSPAEAAGFEIGDVVFEIDGISLGSQGELLQRVSSGGVGNTSEFAVARAGAAMTLETLLALEPESGEPPGR